MKVSAVINKPKLKLDSTNKSALISALVIFVGVVVGIALYSALSENLKYELNDHFINYLSTFSQKNKPELISGLIFQNIIYFVLMLIFSVCLYGTLAIFMISSLKAVGLGILTTHIYCKFALKGIEYCLLVLFPGKFILILAMLLLTQNCYVNSNSILRVMRNQEDRVVDMKKFSLRSAVIFLLLLISSTVDFISAVSFSQLFEFA